MRRFDKGIDTGVRALGGLLRNSADGRDDDCCGAKDNELDDAGAIEQVDGELHQDACGIGRSCAGGEFRVILKCQRKGVVSSGTQQTEPKECHAAQNLEGKRTRGGLDLGQSQDGDGNSGVGGCQ